MLDCASCCRYNPPMKIAYNPIDEKRITSGRVIASFAGLFFFYIALVAAHFWVCGNREAAAVIARAELSTIRHCLANEPPETAHQCAELFTESAP